MYAEKISVLPSLDTMNSTGNKSELRICTFEIYKLVHCCEHYLNN